MLIQDKLYTAEEFWEITNLPENHNKRLELVNGIIIEMAGSSPLNTVIAGRVLAFLFNYVEEHDLGYVSGADGGYIFSPHNVRLPDVAFITKERYPSLQGKVFPVAPDLAVEVVSDSESAREVRDKVGLYIRSGTRMVWAIYPEDKTVDVYLPNEDGSLNVRTLTETDLLDGEAILPRFSLSVSKVFPKEG